MGSRCEINIDDCNVDPPPCKSQTDDALCYDGVASYICDCPDGWTGDNCEETINACLAQDNLCSPHARCDHTGPGIFNCTCHIGYAGDGVGIDGCEDVDECASIPCQNNGTCTDRLNAYKCDCAPGWKLDECQEDIDECESRPCLNGAECTNLQDAYSCSCLPGFDGPHCLNNIDECLSSPCNRTSPSSCADGVDEYYCTCSAGWEGENCEDDVNECASRPCFHGADCRHGIGDDAYNCTCTDGWQGTQCERDIDECTTRLRSVRYGVFGHSYDPQDHGGCDPLVECVNLPGTWRCGVCPIQNVTKVRTVPSGYTNRYSDEQYLRLRSVAATWEDAEDYCVQLGRHLVSISSNDSQTQAMAVAGASWAAMQI